MWYNMLLETVINMNKNLLKIKKECQKIIKEKDKTNTRFSRLRLILFIILFITLFISLSTTNYIGLLIFVILLITFIIIAISHENLIKIIKKQEYYISLINKYENRCDDKWKAESSSPAIDNLDNFVNDLDIINGNSLFKYLNFTKSLGGKRNLLNSLALKNKLSKKEIHNNQESITELSKKHNFILEFQYILNNTDNIEETDYKEYLYFFDNKKETSRVELIISLILSSLSIVLAFLTIFKITSIYCFLLIMFIQLIHSHIYKLRFNNQLNTINKCSKIFSNLKSIYDYIAFQEFTSNKNVQLKESITKGQKILKEINRISDLNSLRFNFITNIIFTTFASINFILVYRYNKLLSENINDFKKSITALEEFELLISLSTINLVKENICIPNIVSNWTLKVDSVKHPLIKEKTCISNDFESQKDLNIITGSNMSGKTSFMKTLGINLILAYNGAFVNAQTFTFPIAHIFTSINVKDDISKGISTFYGELKRIKDILIFSKKNNDKMIIFIDEIFKGTNYNDRILGAKETLNQLANLNCLVFLTTHDFELCEINKKEIKNYHFSEKYKDDKIIFDYKIKAGKCQTTNAQYLMKQMGIIK